MGIYRVEKNKNYTVMNRTALNDSKLSWKAKGIIAYMLSMPDDWKFYIDELVKHSTDGKSSFRSGFNELVQCGYVKRFPIREGEGRGIKEWETVIYEVPQENVLLTDFLEVENQEVDFLEVENRTLLSTDLLLSTEELNTDLTNVVVDKVFNFYSQNFGMITPYTSENISKWMDETSEEIVLEAMKRTIEQNKRSWRYAEGILKNWVSKNVKSLEDIEAIELEHQQARQKPQPQKKNIHVGPEPSWIKDKPKHEPVKEEFKIRDDLKFLFE